MDSLFYSCVARATHDYKLCDFPNDDFDSLNSLSTGELCQWLSQLLLCSPLSLPFVQVLDSNFTSYVVCSKCWSLYLTKDVLVLNTDGSYVAYQCSYVKFPKHPLKNRRIKCNAPLFKKVILPSGRELYKPIHVYVYCSVIDTLKRFLKRPGFEKRCEHWRQRRVPDGYLADVYDGRVYGRSLRSSFLPLTTMD